MVCGAPPAGRPDWLVAASVAGSAAGLPGVPASSWAGASGPTAANPQSTPAATEPTNSRTQPDGPSGWSTARTEARTPMVPTTENTTARSRLPSMGSAGHPPPNRSVCEHYAQ